MNPQSQTMLQAYMRAHTILGSLLPENRDRILPKSHLVQSERDSYVFRQGDRGSLLFALCQGQVRVFKSSPDGSDTVIKIVGPGEIFGEVAAFNPVPYPAHAICLTDTTMIAVEGEVIGDLMDDRAFRNDFVTTLMQKLSYLAGKVYELSNLDVEARFFRFMLETYGIRDEYEMTLPKKIIAQSIGTVPETFSRLLARLAKTHVIEWNGSNLRIDPAELRKRASLL